MARKTNFKGSPLAVLGNEIKAGSKAPAFKLTANDMSDITEATYAGKKIVLLSFPSLDTPVCSLETKKFNQEAAKFDDQIKVIAVSRDLPFAQKRWCGTEGVENILTTSDYKYRTFGESFGVLIQDWQLLSRAVFIINADGVVKYVEYVDEISSEPDYEKVLKAI